MSIISRIIRKNTMFANFANVMLCSSVLLAGWQQLVLVVSNIWQAIRLARAGQSLSSSRQECTESRQECTEPRHRITENPLRRVNSFGWMSSGWIVLSLLTFCRLRPWERRGTPFVRSTYTATGPAAMPRAVLCSGLEVLPISADCNARLLHYIS